MIDRESLTSFVNGARHHLEHDYETSLIDFKQEGPWRHNSIYLFILSPKGQVIFHPATPSLEGTNIIDFVDVNGVRMVEELIKTAQNGGGFVEYLWDNPEAKNGNKEAGFPKVSYSITFTKKDGTNLILGSGFYPGCQNHTINLQKEFKLWKQPSTSLPFPYLGQISLKQKAEMTLNKLGNVDFFTDPEKKPEPSAPFAGVALLKISGGGTYNVSLGGQAWIDVVELSPDGNKLITSSQHSNKRSCNTISKVVGFELSANKKYGLQLSSSSEEKMLVLISKEDDELP